MIYAVLITPSGTKHYLPLPLKGPTPSKGKVVVLNGILVDGVYEKTGAYCPIRYDNPNAGRKKYGISLDPERTNWSYLPPRRTFRK